MLNEYHAIPDWLRDYDNVFPHIPELDCKDVGKFVFCDEKADAIFLLDDDLTYPDDFIERAMSRFEPIAERRVVAGYHSSNYLPPQDEENPRPYARKVKHFRTPQIRDPLTDQIATNAAVMRPRDMPPLDYMLGSQKFVDVRLAKCSFEQGIRHVSLPREKW